MSLLVENESSKTAPAGYDELPDGIKMVISPHEYLWMDDITRANLIDIETEPEC